MTNWNPSSPALVGLERAAAATTPLSLDGRYAGAAQVIVSTANETIVDVACPLAVSGSRWLIYELFDATALPMVGITSLRCDVEQAPHIGALREPASNPPEYVGADPAAALLNDGDVTSSGYGRMRFDTSLQSVSVVFSDDTATDNLMSIPAGKRILRVEVSFGVYGTGGFFNVYWRDWTGGAGDHSNDVLMLNGLRGRQVAPEASYPGVKWSGELCPWTNQPWVRADLARLCYNGDKSIWAVYGRENASCWLKYINLTVYYCDENRVAYGAQLVTPQTVGARVPLYRGSDTRTANWLKTTPTWYDFSVRRAWQSPQTDAGNCTLTANTADIGVTGLGGGPSIITDAGGAPTQFGGWPALTSTLVPVIFRRAGAVGSVDSVPYAPSRTLIDTSGTQTATFAAPAGGTYSLVSVALAAIDVGSSTLLVTVKNHGTGAVLATGSLTAAQVGAGTSVGSMQVNSSTINFRLGRLVVSPFTMPASVDVILQRSGALPSSSATNQGWHVLTQSEISLETADDNGTWNNGAGQWSPVAIQCDASLTLGQAPTAPGGLAISVLLQTTDAGDWCGTYLATVDGIDYAHVNWTSTALGVNFGYYEVQRYDAKFDWATIARITDESFSEFDDYEARVGIPTTYRVRVITLAGAPSVWTTAGAPVTVTGESAELLFTSNEEPLMNCAYFDVYDADPTRSYGFPEAQEVSFIPMHGRDLAVAFHPTERRGVEFTRTLMLNGLAAVTAAGPPVVDPLRDLAWAPLAYVCVRDTNGNRWFSAVVVDTADTHERRNVYYANAYVREVSSTPSTPNAPGVVASEAVAALWP